MNLKWLLTVFESAFVRKIAYMLAAALIMLLFGHRSHAQTCVVYEGAPGGTIYTSSSHAGLCTAMQGDPANTPAGHALVPFVYGSSLYCAWTSDGGGNNFAVNYPFSGSGSQCPVNNCTNNADKHYMIASPSGAPAATGSSACSSDGCQYTMDNPNGVYASDGTEIAGPFAIVEGKSGKGIGMQSAMNTGSQCTAGGSGGLAAIVAGPEEKPGQPASMCQTVGGVTYCDTKDNSGKNCGTVNGDRVCVDALPPGGGCVTFNSGGVACTMPAGSSTVTTPPGPDNGTVGTPAVPDAVVTAGVTTGATGTPGKAAYYTPATVAASASPTTTAGPGQTGTLNGGAGGGGATAGGGTGDCPAGATCTGTPDSITGGADCDNPPVCLDVDPVLCGIVNQQWLNRCTNISESQIASGIGSLPAGIPSSTSDMSDVVHEDLLTMTTGECPAPISVTMFGRAMSFDFWGPMCQFAGYISAIVMIVAYMVAVRIMAIGVISNGVT